MSRQSTICRQTPGRPAGTERQLSGATSNWQSRRQADTHGNPLLGAYVARRMLGSHPAVASHDEYSADRDWSELR